MDTGLPLSTQLLLQGRTLCSVLLLHKAQKLSALGETGHLPSDPTLTAELPSTRTLSKSVSPRSYDLQTSLATSIAVQYTSLGLEQSSFVCWLGEHHNPDFLSRVHGTVSLIFDLPILMISVLTDPNA